MGFTYEPHLHPSPISGKLILLIFTLCVGPPTILSLLWIIHLNRRPSRHRTATVLVLGDIGRSPRMMYHAGSLAKHGYETYLVGYGETEPIHALLSAPNVHLLHLHEPPRSIRYLPWIVRAPVRIAYQIFSVIYLCVFKIPCHTELFLVQNPPSIPTLGLAQFITAATKSKLIIDWHNTGYSILGLRVGQNSFLVNLARWFEKTFGRTAFAHLFVTQALKEFLVKEWSLVGRTAVLHDRPPPSFRRTDPMDQHELFHRLKPTITPSLPAELLNGWIFTYLNDGIPVLRDNRPALVVSSTSWTADEDFSLLITALDVYQRAITAGNLPKLIVVITGLGSLRAAFEKTVAQREATIWKDILVRCVFVAARDYPKILGSADLGVSLHSSSSGRDLPMKVVDMFGCGVPVLARNFACIGELVKDGKNGLVFDSGEEMGKQMINFPNAEKLKTFSSYLIPDKPKKSGGEWSTWTENWDKVMMKELGVLGRHL